MKKKKKSTINDTETKMALVMKKGWAYSIGEHFLLENKFYWGAYFIGEHILLESIFYWKAYDAENDRTFSAFSHFTYSG